MAGTRKLTRAEQKAVRPLQILDAAFEEFVRNGFVATRVEDIAERVGVTKGTIYVYFQTKEALFEAMMRHISVPFSEITRSADAGTGSAKDKLVSLLRVLYKHFMGDPRTRELMRLVIAEGHRFPEIIARHDQEFARPVVCRVQALLEEGVTSGEFRAGPSEFAEIVIAPVITLTVMRLIFGDGKAVDEEAFLRAHVDMVLAGLLTHR